MQDLVVFVAANKVDLPDEEQNVDHDEVDDLVSTIQADGKAFISAKTGECLHDMF